MDGDTSHWFFPAVRKCQTPNGIHHCEKLNVTSLRELQLILTTSEQPKDDLKDTPGAFGLVSLTQIIKTKGTAMLLKGADSLNPLSCYLWGPKETRHSSTRAWHRVEI